MDGLIKKPYEISLWEDRLVYVIDKEGTTQEVEVLPPESGRVLGQYYKEFKIAIIGSNTMNTPIRAVNPKLKTKINGLSELSFSIYSHYDDEETGNMEENPYKKLLINERKVKLRYGPLEDCKWYDFVIKGVSESSDAKVFTYTAKNLFINELSKSGFNLEFNKDLENNMGNMPTLAGRILEGSDWKLKDNQPILEQTKEEPLYKIQLQQSITAQNVKKNKPAIKLEKGTVIYAFYGVVENKEIYFQFVYASKYEVDDKRVIMNKDCNYYIDVTYGNNGEILYNGTLLCNNKILSISSDYRAKKYVRKQLVKYDAAIDKYVSVYTAFNDKETEVYGFTEHEYLTSNLVQNFITNPTNFDSTVGWKAGEYQGDVTKEPNSPRLDVVMVPDVRDVINDYKGEYDSCIELKVSGPNQVLFNSGLIDSRNALDNLVKDQKFIFRVKYGVAKTFSTSGRPKEIGPTTKPIRFKIAPFKLNNGHYIIDEASVIFQGKIVPNAAETIQFQQLEVSCSKSVSYKDMLIRENQLGLFLFFDEVDNYYIEELQFFRKELDGDGKLCLPNETITSLVRTKYYYYLPNKDYKDIESITFLYEGDTPSADFLPKYNEENFEKVRMITASESNRFNLLQDISELFQCWARFEIEHKPNGEILLGKDSPKYADTPCPEEEKYRQQKWVSFYESIEQDMQCGFVYGINLKAIKREVESDGIVSKIVVKNNANPAATDGFCSIARAEENYARENFVYDFNYYIQQGLLNYSAVYNDLYLDSEPQGHLGYYKKLNKINTEAQKVIIEQSLLITEFSNNSSTKVNYELQLEKTQEELQKAYELVKAISGYTFEEIQSGVDDKAIGWRENEKVNSTCHLIISLKKKVIFQETMLKQAEKAFEETQNKINKNEEYLKEVTKKKEALHLSFYKKYSRFIQEGSWISEDYSDDNLYYLDAESTLHTSAQPKVKYEISVLELSQLEGYENYSFSLGDKTYIQDTEFFGWTLKDGVRTPFKEEIIVTEIEYSLDSPENNHVIVQNYKTQFEDLFQRITATTQSVEFSSGEYNKASSIVEPNGELKFSTLQNSIANSALIIQNAKNQSVIWDDTGITTTSLSFPNEIVRIVSGGIFISNNGGQKWTTGLTGKGINANLITAGQIDTQKINVGNGAFPSFRWDSRGINAYEFQTQPTTGLPYNFNYAKFVRLDQYGLYGINGDSEFDPEVPDKEQKKGIDKIQKYADFSLTWKGFHLKSSHAVGGYIKLSSDNDFEVINPNGKTQIKIGLLKVEGNNPIYGIQINDINGSPVIQQSSQGKVWIKDELLIGRDSSTVKIGYLSQTKAKQPQIHEVINANNKFVVYEDGAMKATDGNFTGIINATGGKIGNLTIQQVTDSIANMDQIAGQIQRIEIISKKGFTFKVSKKEITPLEILLELKLHGFSKEYAHQVTWEGSNNFESWKPLSSVQGNKYNCAISYNFFETNSLNATYYIRATVNENGKTFQQFVTLMSIDDSGNDIIELVIDSSNGTYFKNNTGSTILTAKLFQNGEEIDKTAPYMYDYIWTDKNDSTWSANGKTLTVTAQEVDFSRTYICNVNEKEK